MQTIGNYVQKIKSVKKNNKIFIMELVSRTDESNIMRNYNHTITSKCHVLDEQKLSNVSKSLI